MGRSGALHSVVRLILRSPGRRDLGCTAQVAKSSAMQMADAPPGSLGRFGIMAARLMNFPEVTNILNQILALGGNVLLGGLLIAAGFLRANIVVSIVGAGTAAIVICWASIVLFIAMGLKYMGLVDSIIITAFGAVVIGGGLAAALAFGRGGRDAAARTLGKLENKQPPTAPLVPPAHTCPVKPLGWRANSKARCLSSAGRGRAVSDIRSSAALFLARRRTPD